MERVDGDNHFANKHTFLLCCHPQSIETISPFFYHHYLIKVDCDNRFQLQRNPINTYPWLQCTSSLLLHSSVGDTISVTVPRVWQWVVSWNTFPGKLPKSLISNGHQRDINLAKDWGAHDTIYSHTTPYGQVSFLFLGKHPVDKNVPIKQSWTLKSSQSRYFLPCWGSVPC